MATQRHDLVKNVWPDKALYGATLLLITGLLGLLQAIFLMVIPIKLSPAAQNIVQIYPPALVAILSIGAATLAALALRQQRSVFALWGCALGFAAFGMVGLGSALSVIAFIFVVLSRIEGEDAGDGQARVTAETWPDKALAASTVLTVAGFVTVGWGWALASDSIAYAGYFGTTASFGFISIGIGAIMLFAAGMLYRQRAPWLGVLACIGGVAALGMYIVAPLLSLVGLYLIWQAHKEDEFAA